MEEVYEIHALRYGSNQNRTRQENFLETVDDHDSAMLGLFCLADPK